jgi:hypothetical protein
MAARERWQLAALNEARAAPEFAAFVGFERCPPAGVSGIDRGFNDEMGKAVDGSHDADVMLLGRVTCESPCRRLAGVHPGCSTSTSSSTRLRLYRRRWARVVAHRAASRLPVDIPSRRRLRQRS